MYRNNAGRFGPYLFCENSPKCKGTRKAPYGKKCPNCNCELFINIYKGEKKLSCMGYFETHNCRYMENLPEESFNEWVDPTNVREQQSKKKTNLVKKVLSARKGKGK